MGDAKLFYKCVQPGVTVNLVVFDFAQTYKVVCFFKPK